MRTFYHNVFITAIFVLCSHSLAIAQTGACCLGSGTCITTDQVGCDAVSGDYAGDSTVCGVSVCVAACCFGDNTCSAQTRDDCEAMTGTYQGPSTSCELHCAATLPSIFTYQGQLKEFGRPVDGLIDIQLSLWTTAKGGNQLGTTLAIFDTVVKNGLFTAPVNFPASLFDGNNKWLEVAVRSPAWDGVGVDPTYTTLSPRQLLTYAPQSLQTRGLHVDDAGNMAVGHTSPTALLHVRGPNNPTIKIQADDDSDKSGRLSLRSVNNNGMDMYYDISAGPALTFESVFGDVPSTKLFKINRSLSGNQDRVEMGGRLRLRAFSFEASGATTNLVIGHDLATGAVPIPTNMLIDLTKSDGVESSARIEFNGNADPLSHRGDLRFHTRSVADMDIIERLRITEDGKVGIGTTTPIDSLQVAGRIRSSGVDGGALIALDPTDQRASISMSWLNDVARIRVGGSGTAAQAGLDIQTQGDKSLMRLFDNGNVGIGTTNPQNLLQVGEGDESVIRLGLNPQLILSRDVASQKFRVQLTGTNFTGNVLQIGRDDGTHDISLSGEVKAQQRIHSVNASGDTRVRIGMSLNGDHGAIQVYDLTGGEIVKISHTGSVGGNVSGAITVRGPSSQNVAIGASGTNLNNGLINVKDALGQTKAGMFVNAIGQGEIFGDIKSFRVANPRDVSTDIWYASLEGPEAAAYYRGTATLKNGRAMIVIPDHFSDVCSHTSLTVHLTPRSATSKGLAFTGILNGQAIVEELMSGKGAYEFDYLLIDVRSGHEDFQVIRTRHDDGTSSMTVNDKAISTVTAQARTNKLVTPDEVNANTHNRIPIDTASLLTRIERLESILAQQANRKGEQIR